MNIHMTVLDHLINEGHIVLVNKVTNTVRVHTFDGEVWEFSIPEKTGDHVKIEAFAIGFKAGYEASE